MPSEFVDTPRGRFGVISHGRGDASAVLCVHGFPDDATTFDSLQNALAVAGFRSLSVYLRGYDPSPLPGPYAIEDLAEDILAIADAWSPGAPLAYVGHDLGSQIGYKLVADHPDRFIRAVMLAGGHPAAIFKKIGRIPRQWWLSRYIAGMQLKGLAEWRVNRDDFAYIDRLWRRWSPGWTVPAAHMARVKETLRRSMPAPIEMYRGGGFDIGKAPIRVPTLLIAGDRDGCLDARTSEDQDWLFKAEYRRELLPGVGHFPHLEAPGKVKRLILDWLSP